MKNWKLGSRTLALWAAAALASFAASPAPAQPAKPKVGDSMVIGVVADPGILNGAISSNFVEKTVSSNVLSMLIRLDRDFKPKPDLAKSWTISPDGLTYTFNLVEGVKWHDGKPFTSEDVKFTIDEVILPLHSRGGTYKSIIDKVETPDAKTVVIKLKAPFGPLMNSLGYDFFIVPKHLYAGTDIAKNPYNAKPIGTGPYKFTEWKKGSHIVLDRNPDYFVKGLPYLDRLVIQTIPDTAGRVLALESGDIDYLSYLSLPSSAVPRLKTNPKLTTSTEGFESLASISMMTLDLDNPVLKDVRVRRALAYALDKRIIVERADYGIGKPATGPIASSSWAYEPQVEKYAHNLTKAAQLLDEAGYPMKDGKRMTLRLTADGGVEFHRKAGEIIKEQLGQVGIVVDLRMLERNVALEQVYAKRDYDMFVHVFSTGADPAIDVSRLYVSSNIRPVNFTNAAGYRNPKVDALFDEGQKALKPEDRAAAYKEAQKILADELPVIWLTEYGIVGAWSKKLHGLHTWSAYSYYNFWDTWSDNGK
jgi:peptide/nickel transport system substrate-binding protein